MTVPFDVSQARIDAFRAMLREDGPTWFPMLGTGPSDAAWASAPLAGAGIGPVDYGTVRVRSGDVSAPRVVARTVKAPGPFRRRHPIVIETLPTTFAMRYEDLGLELSPWAVAGSAGVEARVVAALQRLAAVPSLAQAIGRVLHVLHVVVPEGPDFDVSYSDPLVPFSVWIGISLRDGMLTDLRLAEGLLHEAMHLQLSLIEDELPLVASNGARLPSPWRNEQRPVQGVLHGTYVFAVIREYMAALLGLGLADGADRVHVAGRVAACDREVSSAVASLRTTSELTAAGRDLVEFLAAKACG